jgi:hypothetical protein
VTDDIQSFKARSRFYAGIIRGCGRVTVQIPNSTVDCKLTETCQ